MASLQRAATSCVEDGRLELALNDRCSKGLRFILPVPANDEGSLEVVQIGQELTQDVRVGRGLYKVSPVRR